MSKNITNIFHNSNLLSIACTNNLDLNKIRMIAHQTYNLILRHELKILLNNY